jgi:hypothetical protein
MNAIWLPLWVGLSVPVAGPAPRQVPDSALMERFRIAVTSTSDTLDQLRALAQGFRNDLQMASRSLILNRALAIQQACTSGASALRRLQGILAARTLAASAARAQAQLREAAGETVAALDRCTRSWDPLPRTDARADTIKSWGPYRASELEQLLRRYDGVRRTFGRVSGLDPTPNH